MFIRVGDINQLIAHRGHQMTNELDQLRQECFELKKQLHESEERYRRLMETSLQGAAIIQDDRIVFCNPIFANSMGYSTEEMLSFTAEQIASLVHPDDRKIIQKRRQDREAGIRVPSFCEYRSIKKDGSIIWVQAFTSIIEYNGRPAIQSAFIDVTERKLTEKALRERESQFRVLFENAGLAILIMDERGLFVECNQKALEIYGCTKNDLIGVSPWRFSPDIQPDGRKSQESAQEKINAAFSSGAQLFEWTHHRLDSTLFDAEVALSAVRSGKRTIVFCFVRDITKRKRAEEDLKDSREYLLQILDCIGDPIYVRDREHKTVLANKIFCDIAGVSRDNVLGKTAYDFLPKQRADIFWQYEETVFNTGEGSDVEEEIRDLNGDPGYFLTKRKVFIDGKGNMQLITSVRDITEIKRLYAQFLQSQKMEALGVLAGGVAHDFNNLLNVIIGYSELVMDGLGDDSQVRTDLQQVISAGQQAAALTAQLLAFGRRQIIQPEILNLNTIIEDMSLMLRRVIGENITIKINLQSDLWFIQADPGQIHQIIMNLAVNARDAMPQGGQMTFETCNVDVEERYLRHHPVAAAGPYVMLAVSDNGIGMDEATIARLFEPFFTTKEKGKGTGLGLSTIYGIVQQNKGYIGVNSEQEKGSTFKIYFPRIEKHDSVQAIEPKISRELCGSETILVVEDEAQVRVLAARILRDHGYQAIEAADGESALRLAEGYKGKIHLILTDTVMQGMGGKELVERIKELRPDMLALYTSGYANGAIEQNSILDKNIFFIPKPYDVAALLQKVREVLDTDSR